MVWPPWRADLGMRVVRIGNVGNMENKRTTKATSREYRSASDFIRHQPLGTPAKDVVEAAARVGIELNAGLVRVTRFKMRHAGSEPATTERVRRPRPRRAAGPPSDLEARFQRLVAELGTLRAYALVAEVARAFEGLRL
jgi:hypothetical protein